MKTLYEQDFGLWAEQMADHIPAERFVELDIKNLVEEVRDLSKRERDRLLSSLRHIVQHLLKWDYQPQKRFRSWLGTILRERTNIAWYLEDSPSLRRCLTEQWLNKMCGVACDDAFGETGLNFPETCPYSISEVLERDVILSEP